MRTKYPIGNKARGSASGAASGGSVSSSPSLVALARQLHSMNSVLVERSQLASHLGQSYGGKRDIYDALGYKKVLSFTDFMSQYVRHEVAARIIDAPVDATWARGVEVKEVIEDREPGVITDFEQAFRDLVAKYRLVNKFSRADRLCGLGQYSIILFGFNDVNDADGMNLEVGKDAKELLYVQPYSQEAATIQEWNKDVSNERYKLPQTYKVQEVSTTGGSTMKSGSTVSVGKSFMVNYTRILHLAEGLLESNVFGTPRLEPVWNRVQDIELVSGGSAEMFWRGAFPGMSFNVDPEATVGTQDIPALEDEIEKYMHGMRRYMRLEGMKIQQLQPSISDPTGVGDLLLKLISTGTGIPVRILTGSERGELASSQDESNWNARISERRMNYAEPVVVRPTVDKFIELKQLPEPKGGYTVKWPKRISLSEEKERADIAKALAGALAAYVNSVGGTEILPPRLFLEDVMGFDSDTVDKAEQMMSDMIKLEDGEGRGNGADRPDGELEDAIQGET